MKQPLIFAQIIIGILIVIAIILQNKSDGIGRTFGTESSSFSTRRGIEKSLYIATGVLIFIFLISSLANFIL
jgi:preprotein translocase subunit SecG